jgi:hypothetical protein
VLAVVGWALLGGLCLAAIVLVGIGGVALARAQRALTESSERRQATVERFAARTARLQAALERFAGEADAANALVTRVKTAMAAFRAGVDVLRFREALSVLRTAVASVRALEKLF